jgi:3-oxoisoapionate kinase
MSPNGQIPLPEGPLVAFLGDDFTGSAATMEVLSFAGLPSVLFLGQPNTLQMARFADRRGIGIATTARSHPPEWMAEHLPAQFAHLAQTGAPLLHYKACSTLDSAPDTGSIGVAIELAQQVKPSAWISCLIAAPPLRRYQAFGHLFAASGETVYRLDRHPVMANHPVTPMREADVAAHLRGQTDLPIEMLSIEYLHNFEAADAQIAALRSAKGAKIITLDCMDMDHAAQLGALIWKAATTKGGHMSIGSQGVEYSLIAHWQAQGLIAADTAPPAIMPTHRVIAISGSVSPITAAQIAQAEADGFVVIALDAAALIGPKEMATAAMAQAQAAAMEAISKGRDPLICTARGPDDPAVARMRAACAELGLSSHAANEAIGVGLGRILRNLIEESNISRAIIAGGDTSGHATEQLELYALTALGATMAGASLFEGHSDNPKTDKLQLALKGGQMGSTDYFSWIKNGARAERRD